MLPPIPECGPCPFRRWPAICLHAREGIRRKCELVAAGRADYRAGLDRAMVGVVTPDPAAPDDPPRPCCGHPDTSDFFGDPTGTVP